MRLRIDHDYLVTGRPLHGGGSAEESERYDNLRYKGTMVVWWAESGQDTELKTELFWRDAKKHFVLFKPEEFQAEDLSI